MNKIIMFFVFITKLYVNIKLSDSIKLRPKDNRRIFYSTNKINWKTEKNFMFVRNFLHYKTVRKPHFYFLQSANKTNRFLKIELTKKEFAKKELTKKELTKKELTKKTAFKEAFIKKGKWNFIFKKLHIPSQKEKMGYAHEYTDMKTNFVIKEDASFIKERLQKFNEIKEKKKKETEANLEKNEIKAEITVELLDGSKKVGECNITTPFDIAKSISKKLAEETIVAKVTYIGIEADKLQLCDIEDEGEEGCKQTTTNNEGNENKNVTLLWDMNLPLIGNCKIQFLNFENEEGKKVFWHSSAHIMGSALEKLYGGYLTIGPALKEGFYYDIFLGNFSITNEHYTKIENEFNNLVKQNVEFEKLICTKEEVLELFKYNPFKLELIKKKIPDGKTTSVYKCGDFIDLCLGPHVKSTGKVKAFKALKNSSAYWLGDKTNDSLQRVYGISFLKKTELTEYLKMLEEAKKRDHRTVGKTLNFYFFEKDASPGSCFWLPEGAKIYNKLIEFIRYEYRLRNYKEVITPNVYSCDLWKTSGHYQNYKDCMFIFNVENKEWGMKPMNCPGHCLMFKQLNLSYRSLPIRLADFGVLHRNEISGSLSGLTRVRRFQQDDSHIFCSHEHIKDEVLNTLKFIFYVYDLFNFKYELFLSTRPEKYIGKLEAWNMAEEELKNALDSAGISWKLNEGDGAFYGPKIDILLKDSLNRTHQCGTIQLDFQLPIRFNLQYRIKDFTSEEKETTQTNEFANESQEVLAKISKEDYTDAVKESDTKEKIKRESNEEIKNKKKKEKGSEEEVLLNETETNANENNDQKLEEKNKLLNVEESLKKGFERPIIIHRAILGSVERFIAILIEHTAGKLPFWISPRQAMVLPVSDKCNDYALYVHKTLNNHLFDVEIDLSVNTLNKKIREAQLKQFNYILVVGEKEISTKTITVRNRDDPNNQLVLTIEQLITTFQQLLQVNSEKLKQLPTPYEKSV